ncbi:hypothetical protein T492DRAFT_407658 [Pavlovales sp. CCMP2436]|nr:hypothetical protein T492DRAFT_407658 [Pavlovales sp. CCMP2436]
MPTGCACGARWNHQSRSPRACRGCVRARPPARGARACCALSTCGPPRRTRRAPPARTSSQRAVRRGLCSTPARTLSGRRESPVAVGLPSSRRGDARARVNGMAKLRAGGLECGFGRTRTCVCFELRTEKAWPGEGSEVENRAGAKIGSMVVLEHEGKGQS